MFEGYGINQVENDLPRAERQRRVERIWRHQKQREIDDLNLEEKLSKTAKKKDRDLWKSADGKKVWDNRMAKAKRDLNSNVPDVPEQWKPEDLYGRHMRGFSPERFVSKPVVLPPKMTQTEKDAKWKELKKEKLDELQEKLKAGDRKQDRNTRDQQIWLKVKLRKIQEAKDALNSCPPSNWNPNGFDDVDFGPQI